MIKLSINFKYSIVTLLILVCCFKTQAQEVKVKSGFFKDSVGIGEVTKYYLAVTYPSKLNVLFPDSTYKYTPFEFDSKRYFTTHTTDGLSYDSVVYALSTFEIEKLQVLNLPVYVVSRKDSVAFTDKADTIRLAELVASVPDSIPVDKLPLKMNTAYQHVSFLFNYPILIIVLVVILVAALIVVLVFGKRIRKHYRIKRLQKEHAKFMIAYVSQIDEVKKTSSSVVTESTLVVWKKYMEQLESKPYTKLTTRETLLMEFNEGLSNALYAIDKAIYGHPAAVVESLEHLKVYAGDKFLKKLDEVKHGK